MYNSKYYTCEQIDQRLLEGYYDDAVAAGYTGSKSQYLAGLLQAINYSANPTITADKVAYNSASGLYKNVQEALGEIARQTSKIKGVILSNDDLDSKKERSDIGLWFVNRTPDPGIVLVCYDFEKHYVQVKLSATRNVSVNETTNKPSIQYRKYIDNAWTEWAEIEFNILKTHILQADGIAIQGTPLNDYIQHLKKTSTFAGIATPTTNPGTPDGSVFYLANQEGTYTNFNGIKLSLGESAILKYSNGAWEKILFPALDAYEDSGHTQMENAHTYVLTHNGNVIKPMTDFDSVVSNKYQTLTKVLQSLWELTEKTSFSRKALKMAELADLSSESNWFAPSVNADGNLQIKKTCNFNATAICKVDTTSLETGKAYKAVVIYKSPDSSFTLYNGGQSLLQIECPRSEDWNQIEFEFLNFYDRIEFKGLANVFPRGSIVTFKSIEFYSYGRDNVELFTLADEVDEVKNDVSNEDWQDITPLCAVRNYKDVVVGSALPSVSTRDGYLCAELNVKEGERYKLTTYSSYGRYPLIFVNKDNIVIKYVTGYIANNHITEYNGTGFEFSIPKDCVKIIIHYNSSHTGVTFKLIKATRFYVESINNKYRDANKYLWERSYPFSKTENYKRVLCGEIGTFIKESSTYTRCTDIISCSEGDVFHIRTYAMNGVIYMFFDENNRCIDGKGNIGVYPAPPKFFDDYVVTPKNAAKLVVNGCFKVNNYNGSEDSITDIFVIKCVKKNEPIILRNTEAIGAITSATKKFIKNNRLINQWDGYFCIAHISDVHADPVRYKRFRTFVDNVYSINNAICTGDLISFHNSDAKKMQIEHERMFSIGGEKDVMIVVGNHEKIGAGNVLYTEQQIKDYSGLKNLYYYKDWTKTGDLAYKVRVIILNQYDYDGTDINIAGRTHYSQAQINWFINTLKEASNDDRAVMVAMHMTDKFVQPTNNDYGFNCNFPSDLDTNQSGYIIEDIIDAFKNGTHLTESYTWADNSQTIDVDADFSGKKGSFIAYMCGHNHRDQVGYSPQHPNQLYLCIASGCLQQMYAEYGKGNYGEQISDLSRVIGTKSEDCFNVYGIDFDNKTVRIVRVGADVTCNMKSRKYLELPWSPS